MKKKILYISLLATISTGCFFVEKNTAQTESKKIENSIVTMEKAFSHITNWKTDETTLYIYTNDGNYYLLKK